MVNRIRAVEDLLLSIDENLNREGLQNTPTRVAKMYDEIYAGYKMNPADILSATFTEPKPEGMVIVRDIQFYSHCEHHMVPFHGKVHIGYVPKDKVVGISKLARLVDCFGRRLQIQERMGIQIADAIIEHLDPIGCAVVIEAEHLCMKMRGIKNPCADTVTSIMRGCFMDNVHTRAEFLSLIRSK